MAPLFYRAFETISLTMNLNFPARVRSIASTSLNWTFQPALFDAMLCLMVSRFLSSKLSSRTSLMSSRSMAVCVTWVP